MDEFENNNLDSGAVNTDNHTENLPEKENGMEEVPEAASDEAGKQIPDYVQNVTEQPAGNNNAAYKTMQILTVLILQK